LQSETEVERTPKNNGIVCKAAPNPNFLGEIDSPLSPSAKDENLQSEREAERAPKNNGIVCKAAPNPNFLGEIDSPLSPSAKDENLLKRERIVYGAEKK